MKDKHDYKLISEAYDSIYKEGDVGDTDLTIYSLNHDDGPSNKIKDGTLEDLIIFIASGGKKGAFGDPSNNIWEYNDKNTLNPRSVKEKILSDKSVYVANATGVTVFNRSFWILGKGSN